MTDTIIRPERAFAEELHSYQNEIVHMEKEAALVREQAEYLLTTEEYNPYSPRNLAEALAQASDADWKVISACFEEAVAYNLDALLANHLALCAIKRVAEEYWLDIATDEARREMK